MMIMEDSKMSKTDYDIGSSGEPGHPLFDFVFSS